MEFVTTVSYEDLIQRDAYRDYIRRFGYRARRKHSVFALVVLVCYFLLMPLRFSRNPMTTNAGGVLLCAFCAYALIFYTHWLMSLNQKMYKKLHISGDMNVTFQEQFIDLEGNDFSVRLIPAYRSAPKSRTPIKVKILIHVVETEDRFYFCHTNVNFFFFVRKTALRDDDIQKIREWSKAACGKRYRIA